jgi:hypothetical protein
LSNLRSPVVILIPIIIFSFCGGYWLNEYLNQRYYRNEAMVTFIRRLHIGQQKGWITVHYDRMSWERGVKGENE